MKMASESKMGFHQHQHQHQHQPQFKSNSTISEDYELISMGNYDRNSGPGAVNWSGNYEITTGIQILSSAAAEAQNNSLIALDSDSGLKHDTGLAVEWSVDEQYKLEEGLAMYANKPIIMQYIKIAASLHDKTVRDVAVRCRWLTRKRRKQGDQNSENKVKDRKDNLEPFLKNNTSSDSSFHVPAYSLATNHHVQIDYMLSGALSCTVRNLLEENNKAFGQISTNLSSLKLQENIDLLFLTRNNITTILDDMRNMPGIMSKMPPLPVLLNEELAISVFPHSPQQPISTRFVERDSSKES